MVYKPQENGIGVSNRSNDRKFMFLSEETKPDYRPQTVQTPPDNRLKAAAVSHASSKVTEQRTPPPRHQHNSPNTLNEQAVNAKERHNNNFNNKVSKFQHIQRKWGGLLSPPPAPMVVSPGLVSETEEWSDMEVGGWRGDGGSGEQVPHPPPAPSTPKSPNKFIITSGSQTVKSLTNRYEDFMGESKGGLSLETTADLLRQAVTDQKREIDTLRSQVATKEAKIRQLEQTLLKITGGVSGVTLIDNNMTSSTA